jgi:hypothetical protein
LSCPGIIEDAPAGGEIRPRAPRTARSEGLRDLFGEGAGVVLEQAPAAGGVLLEDRPGAVHQASEGRPVLEGQREQRGDRPADRASVGGDHEGAARGQAVEVAQDRGAHARGHLRAGLAAAGADVGAGDPGAEGVAVGREDVVAHEALPGSGVGLAQVGVGRDREPHQGAEHLRGAAGALEVAGHDAVGLQGGEVAGRALRLDDPGLVEGDVGRALEARLRVPGGAAVPPEDDAAAAHARSVRASWTSRGRVTDSGRAMRCPSFQSRSRP